MASMMVHALPFSPLAAKSGVISRRSIAPPSCARLTTGSALCLKQKTPKMSAIQSTQFLSGEGINFLKLGVTRSRYHQRSASQLGVRCQVAGAAVPDESSSRIHDYLPNFTDKSLPLKLRALCFYLWTYVLAVPLFAVMAVLQPFVLLFDKQRRTAHHFVNRIWATLTTSLFYKVEIEGLENLPGPNEAAVYVANHQSFLDIYTLFMLGRSFKFISKTSNFLIPIIGWSMYLTGHVPLRRMDKRSQLECLKKCLDLVKNGVPVLFFPEGTRSSDGKMAAFKKGAFSIASKGKVPVVPISLIGTGRLMPNGLEDTLRPGKVKIVVHPPIRGNNPDELCQKARDVIAETLLKHGMPVHS
ncbi:1-acyl-sn-glycerol-3-phosphate acyltransferase [Marchantia polymorpha subsp. ruderalis]|uniref:1-acyl-sn-glycerol-3-phosphate acyltransferase n=1 Tax=Marchantia polymorpha TaxID=3197 RepID=A0A2R6W390_MARPO|nr:hypothetical protein MARPO_0168s0025 [Marchantia polymorpha]BBN03639.1 hypothetical protein Mp_2g25080 [Marchantia polymorpha subsp. ruderalis]PTQ28302.1 hypothetical protein MARPO_0168s0025 [Marchantia polymorpha]PTQ28303.1 hypothetical protein MARPO_0168s0025 [Marchantia polymorpha]BBN03640.1 hypothetical protein Mp_2g25080 [Marchantia polymorpha subsp. ruderalis]|eukprot:PTQ28301.1 hypothetical protein MARPO_0168s0025 [Marchantia polymorpha]